MVTNLVRLSTGVSLQVVLERPSLARSSDQARNKLAICLHPWSWLGGRMDDPVLISAGEALKRQGYHIIRYNSRGVGQSTGWASFTGFSEAKDLEALVDWGRNEITDVRDVALVGYSHGSLIASLHPVIPDVATSHVLISYPLGPRGWLTLFQTRTYATRLAELLSHAQSNVLILYGDRDEFTSSSSYDEWRAKLEVDSGGSSGRLRVVAVEGGSHFWAGRAMRELREALEGWLP